MATGVREAHVGGGRVGRVVPRAVVGRTALCARGGGKGGQGGLLACSGADLASTGGVAPCRTDTHQRWGDQCLPS
eukprot:49743-Pleurochrysis_carterae.AAC.1